MATDIAGEESITHDARGNEAHYLRNNKKCKLKVKLSLYQAVKAHRVVRG
jgi:hypothetical protein